MNIALVGLGFVSLSQEDTIRQLKGKVVKLRMIWIDSKSLLLYFFLLDSRAVNDSILLALTEIY